MNELRQISILAIRNKLSNGTTEANLYTQSVKKKSNQNKKKNNSIGNSKLNGNSSFNEFFLYFSSSTLENREI